MKELNVLTYFPYSRRYYIFHPWAFITQIFRNLCAAYSRATRGYCYGDMWSMDRHWDLLLEAMLTDFTESAVGWPESKEFPTFEDYQFFLHSQANLLHEMNRMDIDDYEKKETLRKQFFDNILPIWKSLWI